VPQLHVQIIARRHGDAAWPNPVWGKVPPRSYAADARETLVSDLRRRLKIAAP
jgi:diadenosine tetraphosphate (Ap4A) HIT family hydrolase